MIQNPLHFGKEKSCIELLKIEKFSSISAPHRETLDAETGNFKGGQIPTRATYFLSNVLTIAMATKR